MKRLALLLSITLSITIWSPMTAQARTPLRTACRFQHMDGHDGWNVTEVKRTIRCAVNRWPVPGGLDHAMYIADRESNFQQYATNPSGCRGIYQWLDSTWASVLDDFPVCATPASDNRSRSKNLRHKLALV